jgi:hypothetical protein
MSRLQPGDPVVLRYFKGDRPSGALPTRLVSEEDDVVLWLAAGTIVVWPAIGGLRLGDVPPAERFTLPWEVIERPWAGHGVLILGRPGRAHSIWHFWDDAGFAGWYVNLEEPWRPNRFGFDTRDHELDLWVESGGSWRWKDEQELEIAVEAGFFSPEQATEFRAEGEAVLAEWPFPTGWEEWRPDPGWPVPWVPSDWND